MQSAVQDETTYKQYACIIYSCFSIINHDLFVALTVCILVIVGERFDDHLLGDGEEIPGQLWWR